ncbi:hypothetical protein [Thermosynechococcus vestitus]|uniref:hypothetical protein n=1 Tax=Thermosynechococcus vestitus TaxID=146786 RepID=UPI00030936BD|nr:hypothetical protein [Thermosynechococcus vestitus]
MLRWHLQMSRHWFNGSRHWQVGTLGGKDVYSVLAIAQGLSHIEDRQFNATPFACA